jgi:hypothetical protein
MKNGHSQGVLAFYIKGILCELEHLLRQVRILLGKVVVFFLYRCFFLLFWAAALAMFVIADIIAYQKLLLTVERWEIIGLLAWILFSAPFLIYGYFLLAMSMFTWKERRPRPVACQHLCGGE